MTEEATAEFTDELKSLHTVLIDSREGYEEALADAGLKGLTMPVPRNDRPGYHDNVEATAPPPAAAQLLARQWQAAEAQTARMKQDKARSGGG